MDLKNILQKFDEMLAQGQMQDADDYLEIVATGLVGDMMDIRDFETHYLIQ